MYSSSALTRVIFNTPLGEMVAVGDQKFLFYFNFLDNESENKPISTTIKPILRTKVKPMACTVKPIATTIKSIGSTPVLNMLINEIEQYFQGTLKNFKTPIRFEGTPFQHKVWKALQTIPFGKTASYSEMANQIKHPTAHRALANANGANPLAIIVPCHRVIHANGGLGGYGGGLWRKEKLLALEDNR